MDTQTTDSFGREYLQRRILAEFALAAHIGVEVESATDERMVVRAPLLANANYKGTAFGGSLFSLAALAGWAWVTRYVAQQELMADAVIQASRIRYLAPVTGDLRASLYAPPETEIANFRKMLQRAGRGRISLRVDIHDRHILATQFDGVFAAAVRPTVSNPVG
jgi:thioesterase domain-containing protein